MSMPLYTEYLGRKPYDTVFELMQADNAERNADTPDRLLALEHEPVFSQGRHGRAEHILNAHDIPVIQSDRGGQVTYHGPGQAIIYFLVDIKRRGIGIKTMVEIIEQSTMEMLKEWDIHSHLIDDRPGVYVNNSKIASLGLRVRHGCTYHGLSVNTNMDLSPFSHINPCGFRNLPMTQISEYVPDISTADVFEHFISRFTRKLEAASTPKAHPQKCAS